MSTKLTTTRALALLDNDMVRGYLLGFKSGSRTLPTCYAHASAAFKHGWLNGRDDRTGKPRDRYSVLRARAEMIERDTSCSRGAT